MQIKITELTLAQIFGLSQYLKERTKGIPTLEEVSQALIETLCKVFVNSKGESAFVLSRFFKSCAYEDLPSEIKDHIHQSEGQKLPGLCNYLTLLGTWGDLEEWRCREKSKEHQAIPLYDPQVVLKNPMLSALLKQIGFTISETIEPTNSIIIDEQDKEYGIFCVEQAKGSKFIPKQTEFVEPFGVKSAFGFGGRYKTGNIYAVIIFSRERIDHRTAKMFLSLDPAIKLLTLRHELTKKVFKQKRIMTSFKYVEENDQAEALKKTQQELELQKLEFEIKTEEAKATADELKKANEALMGLADELKKKNEELSSIVSFLTQEMAQLYLQDKSK